MGLGAELKARLRVFARRERCRELRSLLAISGLAGILGLALALILLKPWAVLVVLPAVGFLVYRAVAPLDLKGAARRLERGFPGLNHRLIVGLELSEYLTRPGPEGYSIQLAQAAVEEATEALRAAPTHLLLKRSPGKWLGLGFGAALLAMLAYQRLSPESFYLRLYGSFAPQRLPLSLSVVPGDTVVPEGDTVELKLSVDSPYRFSRALFVMEGVEGVEREVVLVKEGEASVSKEVKEGFSYRFRVFNRETPKYRVELLRPLRIAQLEFLCHYPRYTGLAPQRFTTPKFAVLPGTKVEVKGRVEGGELAQASLVLEDSARIDLRLNGGEFWGEFMVYKEVEAEICVADRGGNRAEPVPVRVGLFRDEEPFVKLFIPGRDVDLPIEMELLLGIAGIDDYGLSGLWLVYRLKEEKRIRIGDLSGREDTAYYSWDLTALGLLPGEEVSYWVEVKDNDQVSGPKLGRSQVYRVRFPTMLEIYEDIARATEATAEEISSIEESQEALSRSLTRLEERLRRKRGLGWAEQEALSRLLEEQESILSDLEQLIMEISSTIEELQTGFLLDPESEAKLRQIESLLQEILPEDLRAALEELRQTLLREYPELREALKELRLSQEGFEARLDRTLEILKQLQIESKLRDLAEAAEKLLELQHRVDEKIAEDPDAALADAEEVRAGLEAMRQETEALLDAVKDEALGSELEKLLEVISGMEERAAQLSQELQAGARAQAQRLSKELLAQLSSLRTGLKRLSEDLAAHHTAQIARSLTESAHQLLFLAKFQEGLARELGSGASPASLASLQQSLKEGAGVIAESLEVLSRRSFLVSPRLSQGVVRAIQTIEGAKQALVQSRVGSAQELMGRAQAELSQAGHQVLRSQAQLSSGGGGLEAFLEELSQLTMAQLNLTQQAGMVVPLPLSSGLTPHQRAQLERIMSRQSQIRQDLESLLRSYSERPGLTGALEGVVEDLRELEEDLRRQGLTRELLERQERILIRMLDAQRSIRQQEYYSRRREREVGKEYPDRPRPPPLPRDLGDRQYYLREALLRHLKEGYPPEYEPLIRAYYERLLNE